MLNRIALVYTLRYERPLYVTEASLALSKATRVLLCRYIAIVIEQPCLQVHGRPSLGTIVVGGVGDCL